MKHLLLLQLLLSLSTAGWAQSNPAIWCPAGSTWTYGYGEIAASGTLTVRYLRDTVVAGQPAQFLTRRISPCYTLGPGVCLPGTPYNISSVITRVVANRVEVWANGQFYTLYDFAAQPGSSWTTPLVTPFGACATEVAQVTVDSTGRQMVAGRSLRWFRGHITLTNSSIITGYWPGRIYEQFGSVTPYMQPQSPTCHGTDPGFIGPLIGFRSTSGPSVGYNATTGVLLANSARADATGFAVYPSPSAGAGWLKVRLPAAATSSAELVVVDVIGRQVIHRKANAAELLDVRGLAAGTYLLQLREPGKAAISQRIVLD